LRTPAFTAEAAVYRTRSYYRSPTGWMGGANDHVGIPQQAGAVQARVDCPPCDPVCVVVNVGTNINWGRDCPTLSCMPSPLGGTMCACVGSPQPCPPRRFSCDPCVQDAISGRWMRTCHPERECSLAFPGSPSTPCYLTFQLPCECGPCVADTPGSDRWRRSCYTEAYGWRSQPCDPPRPGCGPCISDPDNPGGPASQVCYAPGRGVYFQPCCYDPVRRAYVPCIAVPPPGPDPRATAPADQLP
jgi:hypothetical protein